MPLSFQKASFPLTGLDTSGDRKETGGRALSNGRFDTRKGIKKRPGGASLSAGGTNGDGDAASAFALYRHCDDLYAHDRDYFLGYRKGLGDWDTIEKGRLVKATSEELGAGSALVFDAQASCSNGTYVAYFEIVSSVTTINVFCSIYMASDHTPVVKRIPANSATVSGVYGLATLLSSPTLVNMRCGITAGANGTLWVAYIDNANDLIIDELDLGDIDAGFANAATATDPGGGVFGPNFNTVEIGEDEWAFCYTISGTDYRLRQYSTAGGWHGTKDRTWTASVTTSPTLAVGTDGTDIYVAWEELGATAELHCQIFSDDATYTISVADFIVETFATATVQLQNIAVMPRSATAVQIYYRQTGTYNVDGRGIREAAVDNAGNVTGVGWFAVGASYLASEGFTVNGTRYIMGCLATLVDQANVVVLFDEDGRIVARWGVGEAQSLSPNQIAAHGDTADTYSALQRVIKVLEPGIATVGISAGSRINRLEMSPITPPEYVENALNLLNAGGMVSVWDGLRYVENNWHSAPLFPSTATATTGGLIPDSTEMSFKVVYFARDANGREIWSEPSSTVSQTSGTGTNTHTITVTTLNVPYTNHQDPKVYLYALNGLGYYRIDDVDLDTTTPYTTFTVTNASVSTDIPLYTNTGELVNTAPSDPRHIVEHGSRFWIAQEDDKLWYSKEFGADRHPEFSFQQVLTVPQQGGKITALASMDSTLVIFKRTSVFLLSGRGPNALGVGSFSPFTRVSPSVGCRDPESVLPTDEGIAFMSDRGLYMLTRSLSVVYFGQPLQAYNGSSIRSAVEKRDTNDLLFSSTSGFVFNYNRTSNRWSLWTLGGASVPVSMEWVDDKLNTADGVNVPMQFDTTNTTVFQDASGTYTFAYQTGWLKPDGYQGYMRIRSIYLLLDEAENLAAGTLNIELYYDYDNTVSETATYALAGQPAGDDQVQFVIKPKRQKCEAIALVIREATGATSSSFRISDISMEIGQKRGMQKLPAGKKV